VIFLLDSEYQSPWLYCWTKQQVHYLLPRTVSVSDNKTVLISRTLKCSSQTYYYSVLQENTPSRQGCLCEQIQFGLWRFQMQTSQ